MYASVKGPCHGSEAVFRCVELFAGVAQRVGGNDALVLAVGLGIVGVDQLFVEVKLDPLDVSGVGIIGLDDIDVGVA